MSDPTILNENGNSPKTNEEVRVDALQELRDAVDQRRQDDVQDLLSTVRDIMKRPNQDAAKAEAVEAAVTPARSAGRTHPAALSDFRYSRLPEWQREVRTPDTDMLCARFMRAIRDGNQTVLRQIASDDHLLRADMLEGGSTGGPHDGTVGQLLPLPMANYILTTVYQQSRIRSWALVNVRSGAGSTLRIPIQGQESGSSWRAEADSTPITGHEPTVDQFVQLMLQTHMNLSRISNEALEDSAFNVGQFLQNDVGMQFAEAEDITMYQDGAGAASNQPIGFETADVSAGTAPAYYVPTAAQAADFAAPTTITLEHLQKMFYALPEMERRNATWTGPASIMQTLSALIDLTGRPVLRQQNDAAHVVGDSMASAGTTTLFGRPVLEMPGKVGTGQDSNRLYFGNGQKSYAILEAGGLRVAASQEANGAFEANMTHYRFIHRIDGQPVGNTIVARPQYVYTGNITGPE